MNDPNQGQNQGQPQAAPVQPPPVLPVPPQAPPQAQPAPPVLPPVLPPPPPPAAPVATPFALAPGRNDHVLDWTNPAHTKQYYKATSPLDSTEKFDGQPNKIRLFLAHVKDRAQQFNWQSILTIPVGLPPTSYNLVHDYGRMSLQDVQAKALTYVGIQGREAQDSYMLYNFLIESLTDSFKAQVLLYEQDYTITPMGGQPAMKDGPTLLKRLIMLTYIDNRATTAHIRETLINMANQLTNLQGDITKASFTQSQVDPCLYYRPGLIFLVYIDDCLLLSSKDELIDQGIHDLCAAEPRFNMEDQGSVNDFLGIQVKHKLNGEITLTQPQQIASILKDLHLDKDNVITCKTPCLSTFLLHKDPNGQPMTNEFNYCSVIGKLNFLEKSTRPDIAYAVHQLTEFQSKRTLSNPNPNG